MTDETNEPMELDAEPVLDEALDGAAEHAGASEADDEEFDALFSVSLRAALDMTGPSLATEDRVFASLFAARGVAVDEPLVPVQDEAAFAEVPAPAVDAVAAVGEAEPAEVLEVAQMPEVPTEVFEPSVVVAQATDPSVTAPVPIVTAAPTPGADAAGSVDSEPAPDETAPRMHVVRGGIAREASETTDLSDARGGKGSLLGRRFSRKFAVTAVAASVAAFALVIGISSLRFGQAPSELSSKTSSEAAEEAVATSASGEQKDAADGGSSDADTTQEKAESTTPTTESAAADAGNGSADTTAEEDSAAAAPAGDASDDAAKPADAQDDEADATDADGSDEAVPDAAEHEPTPAEVYTSVLISNGGKLVFVVDENGPETVDPTSLGEFMEAAKATDGTNSVECEVYHIIAQSGGDIVLYAVRFESDGTFYLAKSV